MLPHEHTAINRAPAVLIHGLDGVADIAVVRRPRFCAYQSRLAENCGRIPRVGGRSDQVEEWMPALPTLRWAEPRERVHGARAGERFLTIVI